jgi:putative PIN family toxin of toxin-antitoxin system
MRVVLDTDVLLAALVSPHGASRQWLSAVLRGEVEVMVSVPLVFEYEAVLVRPENLRRANATASEVERLIDAFVAQAHPVAISYLWRPTLRDPGDEMVLEAALNGSADWILTLNLADYAGAERFRIKIGRPGPVWRWFKGERG